MSAPAFPAPPALPASPAPRAAASPARVVELVGPAGAGKSTVLAALLARDPALQPRPRNRGWRAALLAVAGLAALAPLGAEVLGAPRPRRETLRHLLRLRSYHALTRRAMRGARGAIVLDEGPVLSLACLRAFRPSSSPGGGTRTDAYLAHWCRRWARTIDLVVWMDAPDDALVRRIQARAKAHRVKDAGPDAARDFLARYRGAYADVLAGLAAAGVRVVAVDTAREAPGAVADRVLAAIRGAADAR